MRTIIIPLGTRFGKLVVMEFAGVIKRARQYHCLCDCGNWTTVTSGNLRAKRGAKSCGCLQREQTRKAVLKHGHTDKPGSWSWYAIRHRCYNPNDRSYSNYGGRGIQMCRGWLNSIAAFCTDVGKRPTLKHTVDRKDNDGNYSCGKCEECVEKGWPMNVRWATGKEQGVNRRTNHHLTLNGRTLTISQWTREPEIVALGLDKARIAQRKNVSKWSDHKTLTTPVIPRSQRHPRA